MSTIFISKSNRAADRPVIDLFVEKLALHLLVWSLRRTQEGSTHKRGARIDARARLDRVREDQITRVWSSSRFGR